MRMKIQIQKRDPRILWSFRVFLDLLIATAEVFARRRSPNELPALQDDWEALCDHCTIRSNRVCERYENSAKVHDQKLKEVRRVEELREQRLMQQSVAQIMPQVEWEAGARQSEPGYYSRQWNG